MFSDEVVEPSTVPFGIIIGLTFMPAKYPVSGNNIAILSVVTSLSGLKEL